MAEFAQSLILSDMAGIISYYICKWLDRKTNIELVETMWEQFCNLGIYESNVVDTTNYSIQETVSAVQEKIASRAALLS